MEGAKATLMIGEGIEHLEFTMQLYRWQVARGKLAIFEHPATSRGWKEECVEKAAAMKGVQRVRGHQCVYGLQVQEGLNKKPTDFLVNGESLARRLSQKCDGSHRHQHLMGGLASKAQQYPRGLCQAMVQGAVEDSAQWRSIWATEEDEAEEMEDALDRAVDQAGEPVRALGAPRDIEGAEEEEEQEPRRGLEPRRQEAHSKVTQQPRAPSKARVLQSTADGKGEARSLEGSTPRMTSGAAYL
jgi:hypothetical protein